LIDKLVEIYLKIRWDKIQSTAFIVTLSGISLVGLNFWNIAWQLLFEPAGFDRNDNLPAVFGLLLVLAGLTTLVADKFATRITPPTFEQDKAIYNKSMEICSWDTVDWFLNDIHSRFFRKEHKSKLVSMVRFLEAEDHQFSSEKMRSSTGLLLQDTEALRLHLIKYFTGPNAVGSDIIEWHFDKNTQPNEAEYDTFRRMSRELDELASQFEVSFKRYQKSANKMGLVVV